MSTRAQVSKTVPDGWTYRLVERPYQLRAGTHIALEWVRFEAGLPVEAAKAAFPLLPSDEDPIAKVMADLRRAAKTLAGTDVIPISEIEANAARLKAGRSVNV